MITAKEIALHMHAYRKAAGLTQARFARRLKISQASVSKYEAGVAPPSALTYLRAQRLAVGLGVTRRG